MKYFVLFCLFIITSCVLNETKSGYRLVGKDGKVIYFEKKKPEFNIQQIEKQQKQKDDEKEISNKKEGGLGNSSKNNNKDPSLKKPNTINNNKDELKLDSSAYNLRSVMDTIVKNEDINNIAKKIEKSDENITINTFDDIPEIYFENVFDGQRLTVKQNQEFLMAKNLSQKNEKEYPKYQINSKTINNYNDLIKNKYYLQLGTFKDENKAKKVLDKYKNIGKTSSIIKTKKNNNILYRVIIGTYNNNKEALFVKEKIIENGYFDVFIFKN